MKTTNKTKETNRILFASKQMYFRRTSLVTHLEKNFYFKKKIQSALIWSVLFTHFDMV